MKRCFVYLIAVIAMTGFFHEAAAYAPPRQYIQLTVYHFKDTVQLSVVTQYLQNALVPALHKAGISHVGVFGAIDNDTASDKRLYVLIPFSALKDVESLSKKLEKDQNYLTAGATYINAIHSKALYTRMETILLQAFELMPQVKASGVTGPKKDRVYELRSYESPTEKLFKNKVHMFNQGGEIALFNRLGFHAVFYGEVLFGSHMPNLMYMTSFENKASRDEHWKTFGNDPEWKKTSSLPEYQNNVSHIDITFLRPAEFSDL